jgi:hypothetical protein
VVLLALRLPWLLPLWRSLRAAWLLALWLSLALLGSLGLRLLVLRLRERLVALTRGKETHLKNSIWRPVT